MCDGQKFRLLEQVIERHRQDAGALIPVLQEAQEIFGYLPEEVQTFIARGLNVTLADVYGVVSFYSWFNTTKQGEYKVEVCLGTACYVKGAGRLLDKLERELDIKVGGISKDGKFSIQTSRCIGACGLAPVLTVNREVHGRLQDNDVSKILSEI